MGQQLNEQLSQAIRGGREADVVTLLTKNIDPNYTVRSRPTPWSPTNQQSLFYLAIKNNLSDRVIASMLEKDLSDETLQYTILELCYDNQDKTEVIKALLTKRAVDLNAKHFTDKDTSLHAAVHQTRLELVALLCQYGANAAQENQSGESALGLAIVLRKFTIVEAILTNTTPLSSPFTPEQFERIITLLRDARKPDLIKLFFITHFKHIKFANLTKKHQLLAKLLLNAMADKNTELALLYLKYDADPNYPVGLKPTRWSPINQQSLLYYAIKNNLSAEVIASMLEKDLSDETLQYTILELCYDNQDKTEVIKALLKKKAVDLNAKHFTDKDTSLHAAVKKNRVELVALLCQHGANAAQENQNGESALEWAIVLREFTMVEAILTNTTRQSSPFTLEQFERIIKLLREARKPDLIKLFFITHFEHIKFVNLTKKHQLLVKLLLNAMADKNTELALLYLKYNADPNYPVGLKPTVWSPLNQQSLLYYAIKNNLSAEVIASMPEKDLSDETLQHTILGLCYDNQDKTEVIKALLTKKAVDLNAKHYTDTSLHAAVKKNRVELVALLCKHGANAAQENQNGESALELAIVLRKFTIVEVILKNITLEQRLLFTTSKLKKLQDQLKNQPLLLKLLQEKFNLPVTESDTELNKQKQKTAQPTEQVVVKAEAQNDSSQDKVYGTSSRQQVKNLESFQSKAEIPVAVVSSQPISLRTKILQASLIAGGVLMIVAGFLIAFLPFPIIPQLSSFGFINIVTGALTGGLVGGGLIVSAYFVKPSFAPAKKLVVEEELCVENAEDEPRKTSEEEQSRVEKDVTAVVTPSLKIPKQPAGTRPVKQVVQTSTVTLQPSVQSATKQLKQPSGVNVQENLITTTGTPLVQSVAAQQEPSFKQSMQQTIVNKEIENSTVVVPSEQSVNRQSHKPSTTEQPRQQPVSQEDAQRSNATGVLSVQPVINQQRKEEFPVEQQQSVISEQAQGATNKKSLKKPDLHQSTLATVELPSSIAQAERQLTSVDATINTIDRRDSILEMLEKSAQQIEKELDNLGTEMGVSVQELGPEDSAKRLPRIYYEILALDEVLSLLEDTEDAIAQEEALNKVDPDPAFMSLAQALIESSGILGHKKKKDTTKNEPEDPKVIF